MITVTARQAARSFASLLDAVEHGETVVITRDGMPVGRLIPERRASADRLRAALRDNPADAGFADDLERAHDDLSSAFGDEVRGWPGELSSMPASSCWFP
jgi:prevent-host-death family protein